MSQLNMLTISGGEITDWDSFHDVLQRELGFPPFYGRNMNAWIDCMTSIDLPEDQMSKVTVTKGNVLVLRIEDFPEFSRRCPEQSKALLDCTALVNYRRVEVCETVVLTLMPIGHPRYRPTG
jgi:RNAse (barnase) inhibitor barstar